MLTVDELDHQSLKATASNILQFFAVFYSYQNVDSIPGDCLQNFHFMTLNVKDKQINVFSTDGLVDCVKGHAVDARVRSCVCCLGRDHNFT
jgi:hypothetical protein